MGLIRGNTILNSLSNSIPKSLCTIVNVKQAIKEFVVCPKCDRLYDLSGCIIVENGLEVYRKSIFFYKSVIIGKHELLQ